MATQKERLTTVGLHIETTLPEFEETQQIKSLIGEMDGWANVISSNQLGKYLETTRMQRINSTVLPSDLTLVCSTEFPVLFKPRQHDYSHLFRGVPGDEDLVSYALHHVDEHEYKGHKLWIHDLTLHTSRHTHDKYEIQRVLYGKIKVEGQIIRAGETHIVAPETYHPAETIGEPAIMLCVLMNGAGEKEEDVHRFS